MVWWRAPPRGCLPSLAFPLARESTDLRATPTAIEAEEPSGERGGELVVPVVVATRVFGRQAGELLVPVSGERVEWEPRLVFPELRRDERLTRRSVPPE